MSDAESRPGVWVVPALVVVLLLTVSAFFLVGHFASRSKAFDWELASIFGTAVGTVLLAIATALLALLTRAEVLASRQELALSRMALQASTRPVLVDAPLDVFTVEREVSSFRLDESGHRWLEDLGRISVEAGQASGATEAVGYATIIVPFHNVGTGLALIRGARLIGFDVGWPIPWRRSSVQTAAPPGQLARITFSADLDPGDGAALAAELESLEEPVSFSVEVDYSDLGGEQLTRTVVKIEGAHSYWRVKDVALYDRAAGEPFIVLQREAEALAPK